MSDHEHDEHCGCGDHEEEDVFLVADEDGNEREMIIALTFETEGRNYAVLLDRNDLEADGFIFRIEEEGDQAYLVNIEDDGEWQRVSALYERMVEERSNER